MSKEKVELILEETGQNRILLVRKKDGTEYQIDIFSGGGYYEAILLQTKDEIAETARIRAESEKKFYEEREAAWQEKKAKRFLPWWMK